MSARPILDQAAHASYALVTLLPLALYPCALTGAWAGLGMGMLREVTEEGPLVTVASIKAATHSRLDLLVWSVAGTILGLVAA